MHEKKNKSGISYSFEFHTFTRASFRIQSLSDLQDLALHCHGRSEIPPWNYISYRNVQLIFSLDFHAARDIGFNDVLSFPSLQSLQEVQPQLQGKIPQSMF